MASKEWPYGKCVVDGKVRFLAPTTIEKADASHGGCLRKWFFRFVMGWKEGEEKRWSELGKKCHGEMEHYLTTGEEVLGRITVAAKKYAPAPDPKQQRLLIEFDIGLGDLDRVALRAAGIPIVGYTDVVDAVGPFINESGDGYFDDPKGTKEALDWKFGTAKKGAERDFSKSGIQLIDDTQMVTCGEWVATVFPSTDHLRLSHVYTNTQGRPVASKATILVPRERLARSWEYVVSVVRTIKDVATERDHERVPGNTLACESYGGCPYADRCSARKKHSFDSLFSDEGEIGLLALIGQDKGEIAMSGVLDGLNLGALGVPQVTASPAGVAATLSLGHDVSAQLASLANPPVPAFVPKQPTQAFINAIGIINSKGYGLPPLGGDAAQMMGTLNKHNPIPAGYELPGFGKIGGVARIDDPDRIIGLSNEFAPLPVNPKPDPRPVVYGNSPAPAPAPLGILAGNTPASNPALAAVPVEGFTVPGAGVTAGVQIPGLIASVPAAQAAPILAASAPAAPPANAIPPGEKPKRKYTRRNKPEDVKESASGDERWLFVNSFSNIETIDLQATINGWTTGMAAKAGLDDIRVAPKDHVFAFGGWRGALTAVARAMAPNLPPGAYFIDLRGSELNDAVFEGLRAARMRNTDGTEGDPVFDMITRGI